jgi:hypothetical protein
VQEPLAVVAAAALLLSGCQRLSESEWFPKVLGFGETLSRAAGKLVVPRRAMAQEFDAQDLSPQFRSNGTARPDSAAYDALLAGNFADYRLVVDGLVAALLDIVRPAPEVRYVVFHCADPMDGEGADLYYESIDLDDAYHPQTLLAYELNDRPLPVPNGAPIRLRVERQLGYKHAKYVMRLELVASFAPIAGGKGGYWEDRGYQWWAGI